MINNVSAVNKLLNIQQIPTIDQSSKSVTLLSGYVIYLKSREKPLFYWRNRLSDDVINYLLCYKIQYDKLQHNTSDKIQYWWV